LRRVPMIPPATASRPAFSGAPLAAARAVACAAWVLTSIAPAAIFARRAGSFGDVIPMHLDAIGWSAAVAGAAALLLVAWASISPRRSRLEPLWLATLMLPGVVAGLGALQLARRTGTLPWLAPSGTLLVLALMARFAFAAWLPLREPVDRAQLEAAELS